MRQARDFVAMFSPSSFEELMAVMGAFGTKENAYVRQVLSYWEMVAALIVHGTLNPALADDTLGEMYFVYAKVQPFVKQMREMMKSPEFLQSLEKVVEGTPEKRERSEAHTGAHGRIRQDARRCRQTGLGAQFCGLAFEHFQAAQKVAFCVRARLSVVP
jgi:hypothetical protein